jgi:hypothetical protein
MISSALFSRNTSYENIEEIMVDFTDNEKMVNRSILYHMILSFVTSIQDDPALIQVEKHQVVSEFGFSLGKNVTEEESLGNIKYFLPKNDKDKQKPFLG